MYVNNFKVKINFLNLVIKILISGFEIVESKVYFNVYQMSYFSRTNESPIQNIFWKSKLNFAQCFDKDKAKRR